MAISTRAAQCQSSSSHCRAAQSSLSITIHWWHSCSICPEKRPTPRYVIQLPAVSSAVALDCHTFNRFAIASESHLTWSQLPSFKKTYKIYILYIPEYISCSYHTLHMVSRQDWVCSQPLQRHCCLTVGTTRCKLQGCQRRMWLSQGRCSDQASAVLHFEVVLYQSSRFFCVTRRIILIRVLG